MEKNYIGSESRVLGGSCGWAGNVTSEEVDSLREAGFFVYCEESADEEAGIERRHWFWLNTKVLVGALGVYSDQGIEKSTHWFVIGHRGKVFPFQVAETFQYLREVDYAEGKLTQSPFSTKGYFHNNRKHYENSAAYVMEEAQYYNRQRTTGGRIEYIFNCKTGEIFAV